MATYLGRLIVMSPFDALQRVSVAPDCKSARANRFGIGFGQKGFWGNVHFPDRESAESAFESRLANLRAIYGKPGHNWTGRYVEELVAGALAIREVRFIPLKKNGKPGVTVHTVRLYRIEVSESLRAELSDTLGIPVG
jgi:hypothetical protein